jgi:formylmethanofuran dehydrogenase subunit E
LTYKISRSSNREGAVRIYLDANEEWMTEDEQVLATGLLDAARELDNNPRSNAQLTAEFRQLFKELHSHKPVSKQVIKEEAKAQLDAFDELIRDY